MLESTSTGSVLRGYIERLTAHGVVFNPEGIWLCGGAVRRAVCGHPIEEGDFDIYVSNDWKFEEPMKLFSWEKGETIEKPSLDMVTYDFVIDKLKVQFHYMKKKPSLLDVLKGFDFTCCQMAYDGERVRYKDPAVQDAKNLILNATGSFGPSTIARAFRFMEMGFKPNRATLQALQKLASSSMWEKSADKKAGRS